MVSNLRVEFYEKQHKRLPKSIAIDISPSKKACPTLGPDSLSKLTLSTTTTVVTSDPDEKPSSVDDISYHEMRKPFIVSGNISEDSFQCLNSSFLHPKPTYVPSREEVSELLSCIPFFIEKETLVQDTRVLFLATQRIPIEVDEDPNQSFMTRLPYGSPNTAIGTIIHMKDYTTFKQQKWQVIFIFFTCDFSFFPLVSCFIIIFVASKWQLEFVTSCGSECTFSSDQKQLKP